MLHEENNLLFGLVEHVGMEVAVIAALHFSVSRRRILRLIKPAAIITSSSLSHGGEVKSKRRSGRYGVERENRAGAGSTRDVGEANISAYCHYGNA